MARPPIPESIKRQVRQRCGFGCVVCGCPIYEYEHMVEYSRTQTHEAENLTLLCDHHHRLKTAKLLPLDVVEEANRRPHNRNSPNSSPQLLYYSGQKMQLSVGGNIFSYPSLEENQAFFPFVVDGLPVVSFANREGTIALNAQFHNRVGEICFEIRKNELTYNTEQWDVEWVGTTLTIRGGARDILLEVDFSPPNAISINRADLRYNGVELKIDTDYIYCLNNRSIFSGNRISGYGHAFAIGRDAPKGGAGMVIQVDRNEVEREAAMAHLRKALSEIRGRVSE